MSRRRAHKSLAGYCSKIGVTGDGKTPQTVTKEVFEPAKNPLICASSLEEAKQSYGLICSGPVKKSQHADGVYVYRCLACDPARALRADENGQIAKAAPESASTAEKSKSKARR